MTDKTPGQQPAFLLAALQDLAAATANMLDWGKCDGCSGPWPQPILIRRECDKLRAAYAKHAATLDAIK